MKKIGFIGLGRMGRPMALNLIKHGFELTVFDIDKKGFDKLEEEEKFQKRVKKKHSRNKKGLISFGGQKNSPPFTQKPSTKRGKSAPAGYGGA